MFSYLLILGGYRENNVHLDDLWYYSVNTGLWRLVAGSLEASLAGMSAKAKASMWFHVSTKKIHIYGGIDCALLYLLLILLSPFH